MKVEYTEVPVREVIALYVEQKLQGVKGVIAFDAFLDPSTGGVVIKTYINEDAVKLGQPTTLTVN